jgi:hypothetical protein
MTITINGDNINYTLEGEKTAGDVLKGLSSWLEVSGMLVGGIVLDDKAVPLSEMEWRTRPVEEISSFSVKAVSIREGRIHQLETARGFFILLKSAIEAGDADALKELSEGFADLMRVLPHLLEEGPNPVILPHIEESMEKMNNGESLEALAIEAAQMANLLEGRLKEAADPEAEAKSAAAALSSMAHSLDDVAVHLQTGKDRHAMETIIQLTELLQTFMRSLVWIDGGEKIKKIAGDMNTILAELEEALKANDTVLIGDLLEYEIKPRLLDLPAGLAFSGEAES